jgi:uncharacterized protein YlxP (DUF503 family)
MSEPATLAGRIIYISDTPLRGPERRCGADMHVGACLITLHLAGSESLKDKRQVIRSLIERMRRQFNVAMAEVEEQESWQTAVLGLSVVSNEAGHAARQLERIVAAIEGDRLDVEVVERYIDVLPVT